MSSEKGASFEYLCLIIRVGRRGGDADTWKYTQIRNTCNWSRNKNRLSTELTEFVFRRIKFTRILRPRVYEI